MRLHGGFTDEASRPLTQVNTIRNASTWISLAISNSNKFERRRALAHWLIANRLWEPELGKGFGRRVSPFPEQKVTAAADKSIELIRLGKLDPYKSANRTIDFLREQNKSTSTILGVKSSVLRFLRYSRLGLDPEDLRLAIKTVKRVYVQAGKLPTRDQVRGLLLVAPLKAKVLISMLISTGARIGEVRRVRKSDLDLDRRPAYVYLRTTKNGKPRIAFLSSETVMLLRDYLRRRKYDHEYLFDGHDQRMKGPTRYTKDKPLSHSSAWHTMRRAFTQLEMDQRYDHVHYDYHPHVFRVLCLALLKAGGYPSDWAEHLVGHSVGTHTHYLPPTEVLAKEWLKLENRFCFLNGSTSDEGQNTTSHLQFTSPSRLENSVLTADSGQAEVPKFPVTSGEPKEPTHRWAGKAWQYVKTRVESADYDQALAEGYTIFDQDDNGLRVLRRRADH